MIFLMLSPSERSEDPFESKMLPVITGYWRACIEIKKKIALLSLTKGGKIMVSYNKKAVL